MLEPANTLLDWSALEWGFGEERLGSKAHRPGGTLSSGLESTPVPDSDGK